MRFLFKVAFFLILLFLAVAYFVPSDSSNRSTQGDGHSYSMLEGLFAVKSAFNDMGEFCNRNPTTCETGRSIFSVIKDNALEGARISYEYLNEKLSGHNGRDVEREENTKIENMHIGVVKNND